MQALIDKSLVQRQAIPAQHARYTILETSRAYALSRPDQQAGTREIHHRYAMYYCELVEAAAALSGPAQRHWLAVLDQEQANGSHYWGHASPCTPLRTVRTPLRGRFPDSPQGGLSGFACSKCQ